ncbi:hypothetical protein [Natrialbaceae archaeon AArc-T1-2]|uniref:hypothetical protein n=1 Tax=Natrialbaceae archaeon AArc-T1-2 TaxID=3053904 RepID=UPI00255AD130|nr:hypothetical protein [Natrialbaceae archaeon AArc-T1-2]WIV67873.1 hypothetical protein QQ977_03840 [Natrialbaceae archaeon AArc-T1-2]
MSVIRRPGMLGRTTQRRLVGTTAALSAALVETLAVGAWFVLVTEARTVSTAMAGLGVLFCGSLLRVSVFGAATKQPVDVLRPRRLVAVPTLAGCWLVWLLVAERVSGLAGIGVASVVLAAVLTGQFALERRVFRVGRVYDTASHTGLVPVLIAVPGVLVAVGATALLSTAWLLDWTLTATAFSLEGMTLVLELQSLHAGVLAFGCASFLAQQRRLYRLLTS